MLPGMPSGSQFERVPNVEVFQVTTARRDAGSRRPDGTAGRKTHGGSHNDAHRYHTEYGGGYGQPVRRSAVSNLSLFEDDEFASDDGRDDDEFAIPPTFPVNRDDDHDDHGDDVDDQNGDGGGSHDHGDNGPVQVVQLGPEGGVRARIFEPVVGQHPVIFGDGGSFSQFMTPSPEPEADTPPQVCLNFS